MTTLEPILIQEKPRTIPPVPTPPDASFTLTPAFEDAREVIARVSASFLVEDLMIRGYREMGEEMLEWSEATIHAQAQALPEE
jgi:hypothetical protein